MSDDIDWTEEELEDMARGRSSKPTIEGDLNIMAGLIELLEKAIKESDDPEHIKQMEERIKQHKTFSRAEIFQ